VFCIIAFFTGRRNRFGHARMDEIPMTTPAAAVYKPRSVNIATSSLIFGGIGPPCPDSHAVTIGSTIAGRRLACEQSERASARCSRPGRSRSVLLELACCDTAGYITELGGPGFFATEVAQRPHAVAEPYGSGCAQIASA